jgi:glycosidase
MVYYGDEAGMWGANDPCCRKPMLWPELRYEAEAADPAGGLRAQPQTVAFDAVLFDHYRRCIALRQMLPVLRTGAVRTLLADDARQVLAHLRRDGDAIAIVAINRSEDTQSVSLPAGPTARWIDRLNGDLPLQARQGRITLSLAPLGGAVLTPAA